MNVVAWVLAIVVLVVFVIAVAILITGDYKLNKVGNELREQEKQRLSDEYQTALQSNDKVAALNAGRKYKSFIRKGGLNITDEVAIMNDINTMK
jgi:Tfp pilus assembly protein PilO